MKKKNLRGLSLNKKTISALNIEMTNQIRGGHTQYNTCAVACGGGGTAGTASADACSGGGCRTAHAAGTCYAALC